jgi:hypothetical protein
LEWFLTWYQSSLLFAVEGIAAPLSTFYGCFDFQETKSLYASTASTLFVGQRKSQGSTLLGCFLPRFQFVLLAFGWLTRSFNSFFFHGNRWEIVRKFVKYISRQFSALIYAAKENCQAKEGYKPSANQEDGIQASEVISKGKSCKN